MFELIFERRNKFVSALIKLGNCVGRSLRENLVLFSIDTNKNTVMYLTENKKLVSATINTDKADTVFLTNLKVSNTSLLEDNDKFDNLVKNKVSNLISSVFVSEYLDAQGEFEDILDLWESRTKFDDQLAKLNKKAATFKNTSILSDEAFTKLDEIYEGLVEFLKENKEKLLQISEITNSIRLSNVLAEAFNYPRLNYEDLENLKEYRLIETVDTSIYDIVCTQELISTELLEAKSNFSTVWATNEKIQQLATNIYSDDNVIAESLSETFEEIPFLAIASKKQLRETISHCLSLLESEENKTSDVDIKNYVAKLFEMKKPLKKELLTHLNEKYGVSTQNLNDVPSFRSLLNTQVLLFEALQKLSKKGSLQKQTLKEIANVLRTKTGVESIDVNSYINFLFEEAGYTDDLDMTTNIKVVDYDKDSDQGSRLQELVSLIGESYPLEEAEATKKEPSAKEKTSDKEEKAVASAEDEVEGEDDTPMSVNKGEMVTQEDFMNSLAELEDILKQLTSDDELDKDEPVEAGEEPELEEEEKEKLDMDKDSEEEDEEEESKTEPKNKKEKKLDKKKKEKKDNNPVPEAQYSEEKEEK